MNFLQQKIVQKITLLIKENNLPATIETTHTQIFIWPVYDHQTFIKIIPNFPYVGYQYKIHNWYKDSSNDFIVKIYSKKQNQIRFLYKNLFQLKKILYTILFPTPIFLKELKSLHHPKLYSLKHYSFFMVSQMDIFYLRKNLYFLPEL